MKKRILAIIIAAAILLSAVACLIIFLVGGGDGSDIQDLLASDSGYDYSKINSNDVDILLNMNNAFSTLYIYCGEFDHRDPEKRAKMVLARGENALGEASAKLVTLNPLAVLSRGYGAVFNDDNKVVKSIKDVENNDKITVKLSDGNIYATVTERREADAKEGSKL